MSTSETGPCAALLATASAFGFEAEAHVIRHRAAHWRDPFRLYVVGQDASGLAEVVDHLWKKPVAPITKATIPAMQYIAVARGQEQAEIVFDDPTLAPLALPVEEAYDLLKTSMGPSSVPVASVVWKLAAPHLPRKLSVTQRRFDRAHMADLGWAPDAIVWVTAVQSLAHEREQRAFQHFIEHKDPRLPVVSVIAGLDQIPQAQWMDIVTTARERFGDHVEQVIPLARQRRDGVDPGSTLRRTLRNLFWYDVNAVREANQARFIEAMRDRLMQGFERYVDLALRDRWRVRQTTTMVSEHVAGQHAMWAATMRAAMDTVEQHLLGHVQRVTASLEGEPPLMTLPEWGQIWPKIASLYDMQQVWPDVAQVCEATHAAAKAEAQQHQDHLDVHTEVVSTGPQVDTLLSDGTLLPTEAAPILNDQPRLEWADPPLEALERVCSGQVLFALTQAHLSGQAQTPRTAEGWMQETIAHLRRDFAQWVDGLAQHIREHMLAMAQHLYRKTYGFLPEQAEPALTQLERTYMKLRQAALHVPTPHMMESGLSPVAFLCRMQEAGYADIWNTRLLARLQAQSQAHVVTRAEHIVAELRDVLIDAWHDQREAIDGHITATWRRDAKRLALKPHTRWPVADLMAPLPAMLGDPVRALGYRIRGLRELRLPSSALFLPETGMDFLAQAAPTRKLSTEAINHVSDAAMAIGDELWSEHQRLRIPTSIRRRVMQRLAVVVVGLAAILAGGLVLTGLNPFGIVALVSVLIMAVGGGWEWVERGITRLAPGEARRQTRRVMQLMEDLYRDRFDRIDRHIRHILTNAAADRLLPAGPARHPQATGVYLPYATLVERLHSRR
ncbi:MAG: hypothetical protein AAGJ10_17535 [Bacteroidota bacterium]